MNESPSPTGAGLFLRGTNKLRITILNTGWASSPLGFYATGFATVGWEVSQSAAAAAIQQRHRSRLKERGKRAGPQPSLPQQPALSDEESDLDA